MGHHLPVVVSSTTSGNDPIPTNSKLFSNTAAMCIKQVAILIVLGSCPAAFGVFPAVAQSGRTMSDESLQLGKRWRRSPKSRQAHGSLWMTRVWLCNGWKRTAPMLQGISI